MPGGNARNIGPVLHGIPQATNAREKAMLAALIDPALVKNCNDITAAAADHVDPVADTPTSLTPPTITPNANRRENERWHDFNVNI
jgi:hypothetical protein